MARFSNPILPGCYPDPSICRVGEDYYLVASSFTYFPAVPIFHSRDLVNWKQLGHCLDRPSQVDLSKAPAWAGVWAPTIRYHQGKFFMVTTNVSSESYFEAPRGNFIVTADDPAGPWSDPIFVEQPGIDPSLFFDDDGCVYFTTSHGGALQSRIDVTTGQLLTEPKIIWTGSGGKHPEGPHLYRIGEYYYLLISEGGTEYGHMLTAARSRSPWGPFEPCPRNPILTHRSHESPIQGAGHADIVETPSGDWFGVALAFRPTGYPPCYHLGRETFLCPVTWHEDGFPVFGDDGHLLVEHETSLPLDEAVEKVTRDDFDSPELSLDWNYLRSPDPSRYSLTTRPGHLRLLGGAAGLDDAASPTWLGRRQQHFAVKISARLDFTPTSPREEAGLVVTMNEKHHYEVFVSLRDGVRSVVLRRRIGTLMAEVASRPVPADSEAVVLGIEASEATYVFSSGPTQDALEPLGQGETRYLSTEVAGGFTGIYVAMYATGGGASCDSPADFDWFEYAPEQTPPLAP